MDLFNKMAREWKMENLDRVIYKEVAFKDLKEELLRESNGTGRVLVTFK
jgi:hypothetical protein